MKNNASKMSLSLGNQATILKSKAKPFHLQPINSKSPVNIGSVEVNIGRYLGVKEMTNVNIVDEQQRVINDYNIKMPLYSQPGGGIPKVISRNPLAIIQTEQNSQFKLRRNESIFTSVESELALTYGKSRNKSVVTEFITPIKPSHSLIKRDSNYGSVMQSTIGASESK